MDLQALPDELLLVTARQLLAERGLEDGFADLTIGKFSPLHAELAQVSGRASVPYIFVDGELAG